MIKLLVGLGNPGEAYEKTRHNAGFWLAQRWAALAGAHFAWEAKGSGLRALGHEKTAAILLPQTFMNASGDEVARVAKELGLQPAEILVAHDELDLPLGAAKIKRGGGSGGHNGLKSVAQRLGTDDFWRLRLGIGHPRKLFNSPGAAAAGIELQSASVIDFVLGEPGAEELARIHAAIERSVAALPLAFSGNPVAAMARLNKASG
jgi:peptidyl-tRNA hydrolase, PTH1 family